MGILERGKRCLFPILCKSCVMFEILMERIDLFFKTQRKLNALMRGY